MNKIKIPAAMLLALAYLIGQGSVFISQIIIKSNGLDELTGVAVLIVSLFSFTIQFSDFGNATIVNSYIQNKKELEAKGFILSRALIGFFITLIFCMYAFYSNSILGFSMVVILPFVSLFFGLGANGFFENKGQYNKISIAQSVPWICMAGIIQISAHPVVSKLFIWMAILFVAISYFYLSWKKVEHDEKIIPVFSLSSIGTAIAYIAGPISGQIWGRIVILLVGQTQGLSSLGVYGLIKYVQVAASLSTTFIARPVVAMIAKSNKNTSLRTLFLNNKFLLLTALIGPVSYCLIYVLVKYNYLSYEYLKWGFVLNVTPFWSFSFISVQLNQIFLKAKYIVFIEQVSLFFNVVVFISLYKISTPIAIFSAESVNALSVICISHYFRRKKYFLAS